MPKQWIRVFAHKVRRKYRGWVVRHVTRRGYRLPPFPILLILGTIAVLLRENPEVAAGVLVNAFILLWLDAKMDRRDDSQQRRDRMNEARKRSDRAKQPPIGETLLASLHRCDEARERLKRFMDRADTAVKDRADTTDALRYLDAFEAELVKSLVGDIRNINTYWCSDQHLHHIARQSMDDDRLQPEDLADLCSPEE